MAGGKKKKKPASNPARGFATTSIASKPRAEISDASHKVEDSSHAVTNGDSKNSLNTESALAPENGNQTTKPAEVSPEEFEKQLELSELQNLVEKHSQRAKRDAARQISRLQTERRILRGQADNLNTRKWLPPDLVEEILEVILEDAHSLGHGTSQDNSLTSVTQKSISEEDLTIKLWTLQQALDGAGFDKDQVVLVLSHILSISDKVVTGNKDTIWGLEESLEWLARECPKHQLPDYEGLQKKLPGMKSQTGMFIFLSNADIEPQATPTSCCLRLTRCQRYPE